MYLTDVEVEAKGHEVVYRPVAHCELNPIELPWAHVKEHVRKNNKLFTMAEIQWLTPNGIRAVTPDLWQKYVEHVRGVKDRFWEQDGLVEDTVEDCLAQFGKEDIDVNSDSDNEM